MKPILAYIWSRRWARRTLAFALLFALAMTLTFPRQLVFGPRIQGWPWCWWEHEIRLMAHWNRKPDGWVDVLHQELRLGEREVGRELDFRDPSALPILLHLLDDDDVKVRLWCLQQLGPHMENEKDTVMPVLQRLYREDPDDECRLFAAVNLWWLTKDRAMVNFMTKLADSDDKILRRQALCLLGGPARDVPELFDLFKRCLNDEDAEIRRWALEGIGHCGKRGVPFLREALHDKSRKKRHQAANIAFRLKGDAIELVPDLLILGNDRDRDLARFALENCLRAIDPVNYPHGVWVIE